MSEFDPVKAQREILAGLRDVHHVMKVRATDAQGKIAQAEIEATALMKLERMTQEYIRLEEEKLRRLEAELERAQG